MPIQPEYLEYLAHFGQTIPICELRQLSAGETAVGLRHDVDHSLKVALEMAHLENRHGCRATYYLLHTAEYWKDPLLADKCLQLQDFGHEVGLHLNVLTEWYAGQIDDPGARLCELLAPLRQAGVRIDSCATHGDRACYQHQFINYWLFAELRPADPVTSETGLSPEGIPAVDESRGITYPASHRLDRADGRSLDLWSVTMAQLGLQYHATHVPFDRYFTDSGGRWYRSSDPAQCDLGQGRFQVLMHPIHWRGPQKVYFFLSAARSGSKWLAQFLDTATSLHSRHEFCLNHRYRRRRLYPEKHTGAGFTGLLDDSVHSKALLREAGAWIATLREDYAEVNIYLERFMHLLPEMFPVAEMVFLHRDPHDVVRSIMNRHWYDTPLDDHHPPIDVPGWQKMDQFQKVCWYVRDTNERLLKACSVRLRLEQVTKDVEALTQQLGSLGICVLPRLVPLAFDERVNVSRRHEFPEFQGWSLSQKACFYAVCGPVLRTLGYPVRARLPMLVLRALGRAIDWLVWFCRAFRRLFGRHAERTLFAGEGKRLTEAKSAIMRCRLSSGSGGPLQVRPDGTGHAWLVLGASGWDKIRPREGWRARHDRYYTLLVEAAISGEGKVQVLCLMYDAAGRLSEKRYLAILSRDGLSAEAAFRLPAGVKRFSVALFANQSQLPERIDLTRVVLRSLSLYSMVSSPHS